MSGDGWAEAVDRYGVVLGAGEASQWRAAAKISAAAVTRDPKDLVNAAVFLRALCLDEGHPPNPEPAGVFDDDPWDALAAIIEQRPWVAERIVHRVWLKWTATP